MYARISKTTGYAMVLVQTVVLLSVMSLSFAGQDRAATDSPPSKAAAPDAAARALSSANGLLSRGLIELAEGEYRAFLAQYGSNDKAGEAHYGLGVCLYRQKKLDEAAAELEPLKGRDDFAFAAEVGTILGQCHLARGRYAEAGDAFGAVLKRFGDHALADDAAAGQIEALYGLGRHDAVERAVDGFTKRWPKSELRERVEFLGALATTARGDAAAAMSRLEAFLSRYPNGSYSRQASVMLAQSLQLSGKTDDAIQRFQQALAGPDDRATPDAMLGLAQCLQQQGKAKDAGGTLDQILKKYPQYERLPAARLLRGVCWFDLGTYDRARECFDQIAPNDADLADDAAYWTAKCRLREGDFADAAARLERAQAAFPKSQLAAEMIYDRASALIQRGDAASATAALNDFLQRFPDHALASEALRLCATLLHQVGKYDDSAARCRDYLARYATRDGAASVAFVAAENEFLAGRLDAAERAYRAFLKQYPKDASAPLARFRLGAALFQLKRYADAEPLLTEAAASAASAGTDKSPEVLKTASLMLGDIAFQDSRWEAAEKQYAAYVQGGLKVANADDALLKLGLARERQGHHEPALESFDALLRKLPDSPRVVQAQFERGQCLMALKRTDEARQALEWVTQKGGDSPFVGYALQHLGTLAMQSGDASRATGLFQQAQSRAGDDASRSAASLAAAQAQMSTGQYEPAEQALSAFLKASPDHPQAGAAAAQRAIALSRLDRPKEALAAIAEAESRHGAKLDASMRESLAYEKAWCLKALNQKDEALRVYRTLAQSSGRTPMAAHAALEAAEIEADAKRFEPAADLLRPLVQPADKSATPPAPPVPGEVLEPALYRLGICEFELGHHQDAARLLQRLLDEYPDSKLTASALYFRGESGARLGRHEEAIRALSRLVETFADDAAAGPAMLRLGDCYASVERWNRGEQTFAAYLDRFKDSDQAYQARFGLGWAREHQQRPQEAIAAYRQVIESHQGPTAARAQFQIGECLFAMNKLDQAAAELMKVDILYAYPEWSAAALYEAGRCLEKLGKPDEARAQYQAVVDRFKDTKWAGLAAPRLASGKPSATGGLATKDD